MSASEGYGLAEPARPLPPRSREAVSGRVKPTPRGNARR